VTSYTGYVPAALILYLALTCSYFNSLASVQLTANTYITSAVLAWAFDATTYSIVIDGLLTFTVSWEPRSSVLPEALPRVSVDIRLSKDLDRTRWFGLGPGSRIGIRRQHSTSVCSILASTSFGLVRGAAGEWK
jgi:Beta galactosidase small chain